MRSDPSLLVTTPSGVGSRLRLSGARDASMREHATGRASSPGPRHSLASLPDRRDAEGDAEGSTNALHVRASTGSLGAGLLGTVSSRGLQRRDKAAVQVCVRIRPLEVAGGEKNAGAWEDAGHMQNKYGWRYDSRSIAPQQAGNGSDAAEGGGTSFTFDNVFPPMTTTEDIYTQVLSEIVQSTVEGYNGCIFAYGQTSSGKTFTMTGTRSSPGVIPQATHEVFSHVKSYPEREFFFRLSYIEIYNEVVIDLLDPTKTGLQIRSSEAACSVVKIVGVTEKVVTSAAEVLQTVSLGETHRSVGSTDMNEKSSRSHTIFRLVVESKLKDVTSTAGPEYRVSSLNLVDLAGSESASKSGVVGQRRTEGSYINKSLLTLATVIQRLITASGHVPYRDSKLTRILEPALGGNSRTAIICTVTPAPQHFGESMNTLKFAARAKKMKNKPILNDINVSSSSVNAEDLPLLKRYRDEIENLRKEKEQLEQMNLQQQEALEHEKGQVEEIKTVLLHKIERYESMIVDLDSVGRLESSAQSSKASAGRYKGRRRGEQNGDREGEETEEGGGHGIEDARKVFAKLKRHVLDLQHRLNDKVVDINKQVARASDESVARERDLKIFQKAVHEGEINGDEGQHLTLVNQVVKALKEEVQLESSILGQLIADIKADLNMLEELEQDFRRLEMALRSRDLKEKGLTGILKDLHNQVAEHKTLMSVLSADNRELEKALKQKQGEHKLLEEQIYEFVDEMDAKHKVLTQQEEELGRLAQERTDLQQRLAAIEADKLELEDALMQTSMAAGGGGSPGGGGKGRSRDLADAASVEELREVNANLKEDLQRMRQENNTQRLQMQRMQSELRAMTQGQGQAQSAGGQGAGIDEALGASAEMEKARQALSRQSKALEDKRAECARQQNVMAAQQDELRSLRLAAQASAAKDARQTESLERLGLEVSTKEKQMDLLLEVMQAVESMPNADIRALAAQASEQLATLAAAAAAAAAPRGSDDMHASDRQALLAAHAAQVAELEAKVAAAERDKDEALGRRGGDSEGRMAAGGIGRGEAGAGGDEGDEVGKLARRVREVVEEKGKLVEAKAAERRRVDKAEAAVEELQKKNQKLMSALMVQSGQAHGDRSSEQQAEVIQSLADAKFEDYLNLTTNVAENVRDDVVMDMILEYEEQLHLLQRRFVQQLKDFQ